MSMPTLKNKKKRKKNLGKVILTQQSTYDKRKNEEIDEV